MESSNTAILRKIIFFLLITLGAAVISGCDGDDGAPGAQGAAGTNPVSTVTKEDIPDTDTSLDITIDGVSISSPPVVEFSIRNADGIPLAGIVNSDIRFTLAKLVPGTNNEPSYWQSYINDEEAAEVGPGFIAGTTSIQADYERNGTLVDRGDGSYSYTFATDITNVTTPLAVSYDPTLTHRVAIQVGGGLPAANPIYTFRPSDGATTGLFTREIVKTESCNECHNKLALHGGGRIEMKYCVTCHNPGTIDADSGNTVDFKVMIHKIHRGEDLPSVDVGGGEYSIYGFNNSKHDYSDVVMPQDIRNCAKCHDGSDPETPDGDNWNTNLSMAACGSCHDDVDFSKDGSALGANDPDGHSGGIMTDNSLCFECHQVSRVAGSVAASHNLPAKVASAKFKYNILEICGTAVDMDPDCSASLAAPTVRFSVSDPTGATTHGYGNNYDVVGATVGVDRDPEFGANASLNILTGWDARDYSNDGGVGTRPSRANSLPAITNAVDVGDGTFTITLADISTATGTGVIAIEGHPRGETVVGSGTFDISVPVKGEVAYFGITDPIPVPRRIAVDLETKCDKCHDQLSIHGNNRAENAQLCVICHNPRGTDIRRRDTTPVPDPLAMPPVVADGIPDISPLDGKREESIDFKRMIHAIHAAQRDDPATTDNDPATTIDVEGHGFREKGIVIYGFGNRSHDYSHVRFPGILNDCTTCHNDGTYELTGTWETPTQADILASTVKSAPTASIKAEFDAEKLDQADDQTISPTAAVCSACHDSAIAQAHMETIGGATFNAPQPSIGTYESCAICHGPGRSADVKVVHGVQ